MLYHVKYWRANFLERGDENPKMSLVSRMVSKIGYPNLIPLASFLAAEDCNAWPLEGDLRRLVFFVPSPGSTCSFPADKCLVR